MNAPARPLIVGHRGAAAHAPENTLASFRRALADGADLLECDVHLSADGHAIVLHDETVDRTAELGSPLTAGAVAELPLAQLREARVGEGECIPTLSELLDLTTAPLFIEVKAPAAAREVARLLAELPASHPAAGSTVISFHAEALAEVRAVLSGAVISLLVKRLDEAALEQARALGADGISPWIGALSLAGAAAAHEAGLSVNPWTVNSAEQLAVARACGADTITSDDPGWVVKEL